MTDPVGELDTSITFGELKESLLIDPVVGEDFSDEEEEEEGAVMVVATEVII